MPKNRTCFKTSITCSICEKKDEKKPFYTLTLVMPDADISASAYGSSHFISGDTRNHKGLFKLPNTKASAPFDLDLYKSEYNSHLRFGVNYALSPSVLNKFWTTIDICMDCLYEKAECLDHLVCVDGLINCIICDLPGSMLVDLAADRIGYHAEVFPAWGDLIRSTLLVHKHCIDYKISVWPK